MTVKEYNLIVEGRPRATLQFPLNVFIKICLHVAVTVYIDNPSFYTKCKVVQQEMYVITKQNANMKWKHKLFQLCLGNRVAALNNFPRDLQK